MRQPKPQTTITVFSEKIEGSERKSLLNRDEAVAV